MKKNSATVFIGGVLLLIFVVLLFTFQVRQTEVAVVTTFDKVTASHDQPGLKFKWPRPIQKYYLFDKRVQNFEDTFEQAQTGDGFNLMISVYAGWRITDPINFFSRFPSGEVKDAQAKLEDLIRNSKLAVVGKRPFSHFVSTDEAQLQFDQIEEEMLRSVQGPAQGNYGISVDFLRIKKLGLPDSVTAKVFERMSAERDRRIQAIRAEGEAQAGRIRTEADSQKTEILSAAEARAHEIRGRAEAEIGRHLAVFEQAPELARFLLELEAGKRALNNEKTTLILGPNASPFETLLGSNTNRPATGTR